MGATPTSLKAKPPASTLSTDIHIKGNVKTSGDIQISGTVDGDIRAHLLTVGEGSTVKGEIVADDIVVHGRVLTRAISFKGEAFFDEKTQCPIGSYRARGDRIDYVADLTKNLVNLRCTKANTKKVSFILANYPNKDGRLANGVGLDTPQATVDMMKLLKDEGYHTQDLPSTSDELMKKIMNGPTNWLTDRAIRSGGKIMPHEDYLIHYKKLPLNVRDKIESRWGKVEDDPFFHDDGFALSIFEFGNICVGIQPARGYNINPKETYHSPDLIPPHNYLAFYFWLRFSFKTNALVHMGKHGNLEWFKA